MTSQPIEPSHIQQTLSLGDFHAKTYQPQVENKASQRLQGLVSGFNSSEPYAWYDQNTSSWKTYQRSLLTEWTSFSETFTRQGTMQNGVVYQVALLELATKEIDGGSSDSLPTPTREAAHHRNNVPPSIGKTRGYDLTMKICEEQEKAEMLPTPTVCNDSMYYDKSPNKDKRHSKGLATEIIDREMLPTPTTMDHLDQRSPEALKKQMEGPRKGRTSLSNLREAVNPKTQEIFNSLLPTPRASEPGRTNLGYGDNLKEGICKQTGIPTKKYPLLPTPTATDYKGRSGQGYIDRHGKHRISDVLTQTGDNMYLNPRFVEEMMGYPIDWTQVKESKD
tara:strand:- start:11218 stop:12222 length:1005 start_codon:yes stop_codon:yes gene_type:complete